MLVKDKRLVMARRALASSFTSTCADRHNWLHPFTELTYTLTNMFNKEDTIPLKDPYSWFKPVDEATTSLDNFLAKVRSSSFLLEVS